MHGYLWSLNQPIDIDLSDKAAGVIVEHQLGKCGFGERFFVAVLSVFAVILVLRIAKYGQKNHSVWHLFVLSLFIGTVSGTFRCMQQTQRLFSVFHEAFFIYFHFFVVGLCMTLRPNERLPKPDHSLDNQTNNSSGIADAEQESKKLS
uniref:Transmembrane protein n=1 Tax=Acrobeloides nanus TaxID=290746 RepID=A0A914D7W8_9BILA